MAGYRVEEPRFDISITQTNPHVDQLLQNHGRTSWAFITPFNPGSEVISDDENESRWVTFKRGLEDHITYEGFGGGQEDSSPLEKSLLILGVSLREAKILGRRYGQDAIVFGHFNQKPRVVLTSK